MLNIITGILKEIPSFINAYQGVYGQASSKSDYLGMSAI
jgi:hypothetical protein